MYDWQKELIKTLAVKDRVQVTVMMAGRRAGKSMMNAQNRHVWEQLFSDIYSVPLSDLILSECKVFDAPYLSVEPVGGNWKEMEEWAREVYGEPAEYWQTHEFMWPDMGRWYMNDRKFIFRDEKDRTMFILKWR